MLFPPPPPNHLPTDPNHVVVRMVLLYQKLKKLQFEFEVLPFQVVGTVFQHQYFYSLYKIYNKHTLLQISKILKKKRTQSRLDLAGEYI